METFISDLIREFTWKKIAISLILAVITSGIFKLILFSFGIIPQHEYLYWIAAIALLFVFMTFLSALVKADNRPCFRVTLEEVTTGKFPCTDGKEHSFASIIASIANTGTQSVIGGITFSILVPGGMPVAGEAHTIPSNLNINRPGCPTENVSGADALNIKAQLEPIPKGGMVRGRMLYLIPDLSCDNLKSVGTVFKLTVTDLWGKKYEAILKYLGIQGATLNFPQIESRFPEPAPEAKPAVPKKR